MQTARHIMMGIAILMGFLVVAAMAWAPAYLIPDEPSNTQAIPDQSWVVKERCYVKGETPPPWSRAEGTFTSEYQDGGMGGWQKGCNTLAIQLHRDTAGGFTVEVEQIREPS